MSQELQNKLANIKSEAVAELEKANSLSEVEALRVSLLGKSGSVSGVLKELKNVAPEDRPKFGALANELRNEVTQILEAKLSKFKSEELSKKLLSDKIDITLPGRKIETGSLHPITNVIKELTHIFQHLGFEIAEGPEVETEFFNFESLNIPSDHPARDMQDSFYVEKGLLRSQTSPVQIRAMKSKGKPPVRVICPGSTFRRDYDATHTPMFHQFEGLYVDKNVSMSDLRGTLEYFAHQMFGKETKIRFRASYFPFVEPGAEIDVSCSICKGLKSDCKVCKGTGWLEILGAGMVNPKVFKATGFDVYDVSGFAFGMGIDRIAMLKYGINDLRLMFENDVRFLSQF